jgi:serine/threonine-protein kinase
LPRIPGLPHRVADLCRRALAKRPEDRPTAAEAARILGAAVGLPAPEPLTFPTVAAQTGAPTVAIRSLRVRRPRRPAVLVAAAVAMVAMMSSFAWWPSDAPRSVRAEAATVPSAAAPSPSPSRPATVDRPVVRTAIPVVAAKPKPKASAGTKSRAKAKVEAAAKAKKAGSGKSNGKSNGKGKAKGKGKGK